MTSLLIRLRFLLPVLVLLAGCVSIEERRERVFSQVQTALDAGEADRALAILRSALNYDPRDAALRLRLAEVQLELGQAYAARGTLESLPGDVSKTPEHGRLLAHALVDSGQTWQALPLVIALERKEEANPDLVHRLLEQLSRHDVVNAEIPVPWRRRLVRRKLIAGNSSAALLSWRRLPRDDPRRDEYFEKILEQALTQNDDSLLQDLPELRKATPSPWTLLARHRLALADGVAGEIAALEDEFLDRFPQHAHRYPILLGKARRSIRRGQYDEGLQLAREAAALAPNRIDPLLEQGLALRALDRSTEARRAFEMVLALDPHQAIARRVLENPRDETPMRIRFEATSVEGGP